MTITKNSLILILALFSSVSISFARNKNDQMIFSNEKTAIKFLIPTVNTLQKGPAPGIYQTKLNGKDVKAKDLDPSVQYPNNLSFAVLTEEGEIFFLFAKSINDINSSTVPDMIANGLGYEGTYEFDGVFVNMTTDEGAISYGYKASTKTLYNTDPNVKVTMVYKKAYK
ncbi:MAG: hypothetical protein FGM46_01690 [Ferruginibacter sp.]|nr:hypothetical protein [Ferruginibacter sp.]